jgi:tetratricopeptide (TPR) repeat protein
MRQLCDLFILSTGATRTLYLSYFSRLAVLHNLLGIGGTSMSQSRPKRNRRSSRPWVVPPGLLSHDEPFEGFNVLDEMRSELGVILWQALRDVELWATSPAHLRPTLFTPGCLRHRMERIEAEVDVRAPERPLLEDLSTLLAAPQTLRPTAVADVCADIARWASDHAHPRTALAFAQRAALAAPEEAGSAYLVGLMARRMADYRRAESWLRRALALGRRNHDWRHYSLAHMGLANLHMQRGDGPKARIRLLRALRSARRYSVWSVRSLALHDLFVLSMTGPDSKLAEHYAQAAFRSYGRRHPRLPALAHDIAKFWMIHNQYDIALTIFRAVLPHITRVPERLIVLSNVAQAAGGAGDKATFVRAWNEVWRIIDEGADLERVPEALINMAYGAELLGEVVRMDMAASYALTIATRRQEAQQVVVAEELLRKARHGGHGRDPEHVVPPPRLSGSSDLFAERLVEALVEVVDC